MKELAPLSDVVIIVDVLSFTTAVEIATSQGAIVFPYPHRGEAALEYAATCNAKVAHGERDSGFSLSPASLRSLSAGYRLVLPSPNGAALSFEVDHPVVLAACLRNATAVAQLAACLGSTFAVIPAGEQWASGELRPCFEDLVGAGAVIASLPRHRSPEAELAAVTFERFRDGLRESLRMSGSGKELIERGFAGDVDLASESNVSFNAPRLIDRAFVRGAA
jgi:2-phosphosulfolactate phosphatase